MTNSNRAFRSGFVKRSTCSARIASDSGTERTASWSAIDASSDSERVTPGMYSCRRQTCSRNPMPSSVVTMPRKAEKYVDFMLDEADRASPARRALSSVGATASRSVSGRNLQNALLTYPRTSPTFCSVSSDRSASSARSRKSPARMRPSSTSSQSVTHAAPRVTGSSRSARRSSRNARLPSSSVKPP